MKVLLVAPECNPFPVGIAYIASALKNAGHDIAGHIFDKDNPENLNVALSNGEFDIVATGGLSSQFALIYEITSLAKQFNKTSIVGGGIITSEPELMAKALNVDYAVIGEGEESIVDLLSCIENNEDVSQVDGIGYFKWGKFILTNTREQIENLDSLPLPDYDCFGYNNFLSSLKPTDQYYYDVFDYPREYPFVTSRSCPFLCTFCYHPTGDKYRQRSLDSVFDELEMVIPKYKINILSMYDELFSYDEKRVLEFCERIKELRLRFPWEIKWGCQLRVAGLKDSMLDAMKESGCYVVSYGLESYSPVILKSMKKHITQQQIHDAIHATLDRRMSIQGNFIFGDRAETRETVLETLEFWKEHNEAGILLTFIKACPNSALYQYSVSKGLIKDKLDFIKYHLFDCVNMTTMSDAQFYRQMTMVYKYANRHHFFVVPLKKTSTSITVKCPHCYEIVEYKNYPTKKLCYVNMMYCRSCRKRFFSASRLYILLNVKLIAYILPPFSFHVYVILKKFLSKLHLGRNRH